MGQMDTLRQSIAVSAVLLAALFLLPLAVVAPFSVPAQAAPEALLTAAPQAPAALPEAAGETFTLRVLQGGQVTEMGLEDYLVGVVRAEMPASFEPDALKAQAAAARTYTLYKMRTGSSHADAADICTDSTCCQAYIEETAALANWGEQAEEYREKTVRAVAETAGQVILYGGEPVLAVFHSSSAGLTRPAGEVWSSDLPYLQAVSSAETGTEVPDYYSRAEFSAEGFKKAVLAAYPEADLSGSIGSWLKNAQRDAAGSVQSVEVGGLTLRGNSLRTALGLRSACFEWDVQDGRIVFYVTGYGHGVGLSQYGANQMAKAGADWRDILLHYYSGVTVGAYDFTNDRQA